MVQTWVMVLLPYTQNHGYSITSNDVYAHVGVLGQGDVGRIGVVSGGASRNTRFRAEVVVNHLSRNIPLPNYWTFKIPQLRCIHLSSNRDSSCLNWKLVILPGFKTTDYVMHPRKALLHKKRCSRVAGNSVITINDERRFFVRIFDKWFYRCII